MTLSRKARIAAVALALCVVGSLAPLTARGHSYYGGTYCDRTTGTLFRYHYHGVYDVGGREAYHSQHMHAIGYCV